MSDFILVELAMAAVAMEPVQLIIDGTILQAGAYALIEHAGFGYPTCVLD